MSDRIVGIIAQVFEVPADSLKPGSTPEDIETWDSIHHLNLVLAFEQEFGIQFEPEEIEQLLSVELIVSMVEEKMPVLPANGKEIELLHGY